MAFRKRTGFKKQKRVYKRPTAFKKQKQVSSAVKQYVKRTIHSNVENKCVQINFGGPFGNVFESLDFNSYSMCPGVWTISQGITQGTRIGNQIKVRKVMLNYILRPSPYDVVTNINPRPVEVQLLLGRVKLTPGSTPNGTDVNNMFQAGASVSAPMGGTRDLISVINTDYWDIKKRWNHKIGYASNDGTGSIPGSQYNTNNDFKLNVVKRMDITKMCPATCTFNDNVGVSLTKNLYFMYYAVSADGIVYPATAQPANIEFWVDFHYEDA